VIERVSYGLAEDLTCWRVEMVSLVNREMYGREFEEGDGLELEGERKSFGVAQSRSCVDSHTLGPGWLGTG
jgi:hypothetical protein